MVYLKKTIKAEIAAEFTCDASTWLTKLALLSWLSTSTTVFEMLLSLSLNIFQVRWKQAFDVVMVW
ncbi:hypothetical protein F444_06170 [Phytophthora nicotianae P1976]|uniref:Uncharacterized protein n=1 Tax=Phytophthora nicotianae P1976 TaxID=1317066 RepID=A0A081AJF1_PHYNI|nr:hypothetical protein F444_06170 [Phytophthora nicotianae P1976]